MIKLFFKDGIESPAFMVKGEVYDGFKTTVINRGVNDIKKVVLNVASNRIVEGLKFIAYDSELKKDVCLAKMEPCDCGDDEDFVLPEEHQIIGIFGITSTDKLCD